MLQNTFCHASGIGPKSESQIWDAGLHSWGDFVDCAKPPMAPRKAAALKELARTSMARLDADDPDYFYRQLPSAEHWRLFPHFRHTVAYFDIETTGLGTPSDYITSIVLYDGQSIRHYVQGDNLLDFKDDIEQYRLLVSYNGKTFDSPFIRNYLGAPMNQAHIDLRYILASLGLRGGLKGIERHLGIARHGLEDVDGYFAVLLWFDYARDGNEKALQTLLAYNAADVINLEMLMVLAYNLKLEQTPFAESHRLPLPELPEVPFEADPETIARLKPLGGDRFY
jgi:hypothetical protein